MIAVGQKIRKIRELRNLTQNHMAEKLGLSQQGYGKIERDEADLSLSRLQEIASILEVTPENILGFDEKYVLNNYHTFSGNSGYNMTVNGISEKEEKLYQARIAALEKEVEYLRGIVEKLMNQ